MLGDWTVSPDLNQIRRKGEDIVLQNLSMQVLVYLFSGIISIRKIGTRDKSNFIVIFVMITYHKLTDFLIICCCVM